MGDAIDLVEEFWQKNGSLLPLGERIRKMKESLE